MNLGNVEEIDHNEDSRGMIIQFFALLSMTERKIKIENTTGNVENEEKYKHSKLYRRVGTLIWIDWRRSDK